jgi:NAD-specific glutamate dehydrogenase
MTAQRKAFIKSMYKDISDKVLLKEYKNIKSLSCVSLIAEQEYKLALEVLVELLQERNLEIPK